MKIVVVGGSGFLGSHVADELSKSGHKVTIFDIKRSKWLRKDQKMQVGNILKSKKLEKIIKNNDIVFHFASIEYIFILYHVLLKCRGQKMSAFCMCRIPLRGIWVVGFKVRGNA